MADYVISLGSQYLTGFAGSHWNRGLEDESVCKTCCNSQLRYFRLLS